MSSSAAARASASTSPAPSGRFRYDQILAGVAVVTILSIVLFGLIHVLARLATPWQYVDAGSGVPTSSM